MFRNTGVTRSYAVGSGKPHYPAVVLRQGKEQRLYTADHDDMQFKTGNPVCRTRMTKRMVLVGELKTMVIVMPQTPEQSALHDLHVAVQSFLGEDNGDTEAQVSELVAASISVLAVSGFDIGESLRGCAAMTAQKRGGHSRSAKVLRSRLRSG